MKTTGIVMAAAAVLALGMASPKPAEARGFGPAFAGGLVAGAVVGGLASSAYGPGYGYYDSYAAAPGYYGGPAYYGYAPQYNHRGYPYGGADQSEHGGQPYYAR